MIQRDSVTRFAVFPDKDGGLESSQENAGQQEGKQRGVHNKPAKQRWQKHLKCTNNCYSSYLYCYLHLYFILVPGVWIHWRIAGHLHIFLIHRLLPVAKIVNKSTNWCNNLIISEKLKHHLNPGFWMWAGTAMTRPMSQAQTMATLAAHVFFLVA